MSEPGAAARVGERTAAYRRKVSLLVAVGVVACLLFSALAAAGIDATLGPASGAVPSAQARGPATSARGLLPFQTYTPLMTTAGIVTAGCTGSGWQVTFNASARGGVPPYNFSWRFGDSSAVSNVSNPVHVYAGDGLYTAWATAWDSQGHHNAANVSVSSQHCSPGGGGTWYSPSPASPAYWALVAGLVLAVIVAVGVAVWAVRGRRPPPADEPARGQEAAESFE